MNQYTYRTEEPFSSPFWWTNRQLQAHYRGVSTGELQNRLEWLYDHAPADTGAPAGKPREWHCLLEKVKCPLCLAWINWNDECTLVSHELKRRNRVTGQSRNAGAAW